MSGLTGLNESIVEGLLHSIGVYGKSLPTKG